MNEALLEDPTTPGTPKLLIVPISDLLDVFIKKIEDELICLAPEDLYEILTQIFMVLLNEGDDRMRKLFMLPDFNRMVSGDNLNQEQRHKLRHSVHALAVGIRHRVLEIDAWRKTTDNLPYAFHRMIGQDVVLTYIPY